MNGEDRMAGFETAKAALNFLDSEIASRNRLQDDMRSLARDSNKLLRSRGALVKGTLGSYGGTEGLLGSSRRGIRIQQGTEPVSIEHSSIALVDTPYEKERDIYLIAPSPNYRRNLSGRILAVIAVSQELKIPGVETVTRRHLDAAKFLVDTIASNLEPMDDDHDTSRLQLPTIVEPGYFPINKPVNLRELDSLDWPIMV